MTKLLGETEGLSQLKYAQFKSIQDFVRFVAASQIPFIHHANINGRNVYFIQLIGFGERMVYYIELEQPIKEKYIIFNRFRDQISFANRIEADPQSIAFPILELERTNIFTEYPPT
jgi:hypothetical protein